MNYNNKTTIKILGCGSSTGVPRIGNDWGICDPKNKKNNRNRCSLLVEKYLEEKVTRVLVDTGPDLRIQLNNANAMMIDAVFYTHEHADHTHGIDDLRVFSIRKKSKINIFASKNTSYYLENKFGYCFETPKESNYPAILSMNIIEKNLKYTIAGEGGDITIEPFELVHGNIKSFGFKINNFAYSPDVSFIPLESHKYIQGLSCWIVDALRWDKHPTHLSVNEALELIKKFKVRNGILTNMHIDLDYSTLSNYLPGNVVPGYDGLTYDIT
ncbi:MBL fold metallo-hydrolase [Hyphomicrobiales bacterium]|nr:MBL fold metallo-hydrolase [Hyphomicrobiales bacterium]